MNLNITHHKTGCNKAKIIITILISIFLFSKGYSQTAVTFNNPNHSTVNINVNSSEMMADAVYCTVYGSTLTSFSTGSGTLRDPVTNASASITPSGSGGFILLNGILCAFSYSYNSSTEELIVTIW